MVPVRKLLPTVCDAVKDLRDVKGSSFKSIAEYIKHAAKENLATTSIRKAVNTAVDSKLLKQTLEGRYKLNTMSESVTDAETTVDHSDKTSKPSDCLPTRSRRLRSRSSKRGPKRRSRKSRSRRLNSHRVRRRQRRNRRRGSRRSCGSRERHRGRSSRKHHRSSSFSDRSRHRSRRGSRRRRHRRCAGDDSYN